MIRDNTVYSEKSGKKLSRKYKTKGQAVQRLHEIEYFKHAKDRKPIDIGYK